MVSVQIVDDHKLFVEGLEQILANSGVVEVIGKAYSIHECWQMLLWKQADVLLLDIQLPDGSGLDVCEQILLKYPHIKILALTSFSEYSKVTRMLDSGALGYILKNAMVDEMIQGILSVASGKRFLCAEVDLLLQKEPDETIVLTGKERELLRLITEGYTNFEIAKIMLLSFETVNSYRKNLLFKFQARNTAMLVKMALEQKIV